MDKEPYSNLAPGMRPPDGEVVRSQVVFDRSTFANQRNNRAPFIAGPVGPKQHRVLAKDIVFSPKPSGGLGRNERAAAYGDVPGFSVLNGLGRAGETKHSLLKRLWFAGLSTKTMESNALNTDTGIYTAVDKQGLTWMHNKDNRTIRAGDEVMYDIPDSTEDAERREQALGPPEGGTPERRFTAFPTIWNVGKARDGLVRDWDGFLRGDRDVNSVDLPSTPMTIGMFRQMMVAGIALGYAYTNPAARPASPADFITAVRTATSGADPAGANTRLLVQDVMNGQLDPQIAALFFPRAGEYVVDSPRVDPNAGAEVRVMNAVQRAGIDNLLTLIDMSIGESGRSRVIGRAVNNAKPGDPLSIILYG